MQPVDAVKTLRAEIKRLQADVRALSSNYTNMTYQAYYNTLATTLRDVLDYKKELRVRKLPDPDSMTSLLSMSESIASAACAAFNAYLDANGMILLESKPALSNIAGIYRSYGERISNCLANSIKMETNRRRGVRNGTMSILRQNQANQRAIPVPRTDPVYRQTLLRKKTTKKATSRRF